MKCAEGACNRVAEVAITLLDAPTVIVLACFSCGVRLSLSLRGQMELLDGTRRRLAVTGNNLPPRNDCVK